jgi:hypothetical protein
MTSSVGSDVTVSVGSTVAGFIVWLAHQHPPLEQRRHCPEQVERFLRWQHPQRAQGLAHDEEAYFAHLRAGGATDAQVQKARTAIGRLRQYPLSTTGPPRLPVGAAHRGSPASR